MPKLKQEGPHQARFRWLTNETSVLHDQIDLDFGIHKFYSIVLLSVRESIRNA